MAPTNWADLHFGFYHLLLMIGTALLGSWHCAGMCGPISLLVGRGRGQYLYQSGRLFGYALLGVSAGWMGDQLLLRLFDFTHSPWRWAAVLAFALLLALLLPRFAKRIQRALPKLIRSGPQSLRPAVLGLGTALFPCGWLWTFVAAAAVTHSAVSGGFVMFALWLGGLPALIAFGRLRAFFTTFVPAAWQLRVSIVMWIAGLWGVVTHFTLR